MVLVTASQDVPIAQYSLLLYLGASISLVCFLALLFKVKYSVKKSALYTFFCFAMFYLLAFAQINKFYQAEVSGEYLKLLYAAPKNDSFVLINDIQAITFGIKGRSGGKCYLVIKTQAGEKYQSTILSNEVEYCKAKRKALMSAFNL